MEATSENLIIGEKTDEEDENLSGELFVKGNQLDQDKITVYQRMSSGPTLFRHYFHKEEETRKSFNKEKFFGTGKYFSSLTCRER